MTQQATAPAPATNGRLPIEVIQKRPSAPISTPSLDKAVKSAVESASLALVTMGERRAAIKIFGHGFKTNLQAASQEMRSMIEAINEEISYYGKLAEGDPTNKTSYDEVISAYQQKKKDLLKELISFCSPAAAE